MALKKSKGIAATVLLSGGIDSSACVDFLLRRGFDVSGLFIDYGQPAKKPEKTSSNLISEHYKIPLKTSHLISKVKFKIGEIPGRNAFLIFSSLMLSELDSGLLAIGIHSGLPYYDCSKVFFEKISAIVAEYSSGQIRLIAPFLDWGKIDIYKYCVDKGVPLDLTYSCEKGSIPPCGKCSSCKDRAELKC